MPANRFQPIDSAPWYRQLWAWIPIALLGASVAGSLVSLLLATRGADSVVRDDWYRAGQAINRTLARDHVASRLELRAEFSVVSATGELSLDLRGRGVEHLTRLLLQLDHPTLAERDQRLVLSRREPGGPFEGRLASRGDGRWHATLTPLEAGSDTGPEWRLRGVVRLPTRERLRLDHEPL